MENKTKKSIWVNDDVSDFIKNYSEIHGFNQSGLVQRIIRKSDEYLEATNSCLFNRKEVE